MLSDTFNWSTETVWKMNKSSALNISLNMPKHTLGLAYIIICQHSAVFVCILKQYLLYSWSTKKGLPSYRKANKMSKLSQYFFGAFDTYSGCVFVVWIIVKRVRLSIDIQSDKYLHSWNWRFFAIAGNSKNFNMKFTLLVLTECYSMFIVLLHITTLFCVYVECFSQWKSLRDLFLMENFLVGRYVQENRHGAKCTISGSSGVL